MISKKPCESLIHSGASRRGFVLGRRWLTLGGLSLLLGACKIPSFGAYQGNTVQGNATYHLFQGFMVASIPILAIVFGLLGYAMIKFRKRSDEIPLQTHSYVPIEIVYTVVPVLIVVALFVFTVRVENKVDAVSTHPNLQVDVTAYQWGWKFYYPSLKITEASQNGQYPQLVLPSNETTKIRLVSNDVVHGFYIPAFEFSRYALPGVTNYFDFTPKQNGTFVGRCSQLCGLYHAEMLFSVKVVSPAQFLSWANTQQSKVTA